MQCRPSVILKAAPPMIFRRILSLSLVFALSSLRAAPDLPNPTDAQNGIAETPHHKRMVTWTCDGDVAGTWTGRPKIEGQGPQQSVFSIFPKGSKAAYFAGRDS